MRVGLCQLRAGVDVQDNLAQALTLLDEAANGGANLAALPEFFSYLGPSRQRPHIAEPVPGPTSDRLAEVARQRQMWVLAGGMLEAAGGKVFDSAVLLDPAGEIVARYRKIHLFDVDLPGQAPIRESDTITPGSDLVTHDLGGWCRVGLSICYDLRFPELYLELTARGADVLLVPAQFQEETGRDHWHALLRARAIENQCFVVAPAQWGSFGSPDRPRRSYGHSLVVDPWGRVVTEAPGEGTGVWFADLDLGEVRRVRRALPTLTHRRLGS
jgi:predicted amidohydrolase